LLWNLKGLSLSKIGKGIPSNAHIHISLKLAALSQDVYVHSTLVSVICLLLPKGLKSLLELGSVDIGRCLLASIWHCLRLLSGLVHS